MPGAVKVITTFSTMIAPSWRRSRLSRFSVTARAPSRPKMAPEAPAVASHQTGEQIHRDGTAEQAEQIDRSEPNAAENAFQPHPDQVQRQHVHRHVQHAVVQESAGDQPPVVTVGDQQWDQRALLHPAACGDAAFAARRDDHEQEDRDVQPDQDERDQRLLAVQAARDRPGRPHCTAALGDALPAVEPDRRRRQALRAGGASTSGAGQSGRPVRVPHTDRSGGRRLDRLLPGSRPRPAVLLAGLLAVLGAAVLTAVLAARRRHVPDLAGLRPGGAVVRLGHRAIRVGRWTSISRRPCRRC